LVFMPRGRSRPGAIQNGSLPAFPAVSVSALLAINFVFGIAGQFVNVTVMAVRQAVTPDGLQGRAAATITFVGMGMAPLGSLLGGFLAMEWGLRTSLLVMAAGMMLPPVVMALSPLARLGRVLPAVQEAPPRVARSEAYETVADCPPGDVEIRSH
jgi:MFS family permease